MKFSKVASLSLLSPLQVLSLPGADLLPSFSKKRSGIAFHSKSEKHIRRILDDEKMSPTCDIAFMECAMDQDCAECFEALDTSNVDWATVDPMTPCEDILGLITKKGYCKKTQKSKSSREAFCKTFDACVWFGDEDEDATDDQNADTDDDARLDCSTLTSCSWPGMHATFIGDGKCHDYSCYNTEICDYDGGDCCEDTCQNDVPFQYSDCGDDGFYCRNPESAACDPDFTDGCEEKEDKKPKDVVVCDKDVSPFLLDMYDSWGDGWDSTVISIKPVADDDDSEEEVYFGGLESGDHGSEIFCLAKGCYHVTTGGGVWGNEVAWEIHTGRSKSGPPIAFGGAPMDCTFSVGSGSCENDCNGRTISAHDDQKMSYEKLLSCISDSCLIQVGMCKNDSDCEPCLADQPPEFCRTNDNYNNLVECTLCNCVPQKEDSDYCEKKERPSSTSKFFPDDSSDVPPTKTEDKSTNEGECNSDQTLKGSSAVLKYSTCSSIDQTQAILNEWDENNFGPLDEFEACSHSYQNDYAHGGKKALDCMRILESIANEENEDMREDIWTLANQLYHDAESFCECTMESNKLCPSCNSFAHFKTLLHESLDACQALDEIDCAAWSEFYDPCKENVYDKFNKIDFSNKAQCDFVHSECGGAGPFPAFRRLDCGAEIPKAAWDFYISYSRGCLEDDNTPSKNEDKKPSKKEPDAPSPSPPKPTPPAPTPAAKPSKPYVPSSGSTPFKPSSSDPKPYIPSSTSSSSSSSSSSKEYKKEKKSHHFLKFIFFSSIIAGGVYFYKKRNEDFDFQRYRRQQRYQQAPGEDLYAGLTGGQRAPSFEPPTLPPQAPGPAPGGVV